MCDPPLSESEKRLIRDALTLYDELCLVYMGDRVEVMNLRTRFPSQSAIR